MSQQQRPRDLLEFLRRASNEDEAPAPEQPKPRVEPARKPTREPSSPQVSRSQESRPHVSVHSGDVPLVVVRRSQVVVAAVTACLLIVLAFLLGLVSGSGEGEEGAEATIARTGTPLTVWTIRCIAYDDTRKGEIAAKTVADDLARQGLDEVTIERLDRDGKLVVTIGSWLSNPHKNRQAQKLLATVQGLKAVGDPDPFKEAYFVQLKR
ncbi:MAG: hypothetical protein AAGD14_14240 [Planctomycetota bacterium]